VLREEAAAAATCETRRDTTTAWAVAEPVPVHTPFSVEEEIGGQNLRGILVSLLRVAKLKNHQTMTKLRTKRDCSSSLSTACSCFASYRRPDHKDMADSDLLAEDR
jgi:hypothetical protein